MKTLDIAMPRPVSNRRKYRILAICGVGLLSLVVLILCICLIDTKDASLTPAQIRQDPGTLKLVQVIFRHGDRNPGNGYPNDPYNDGHAYPEGWSALTKAGSKRLLSLGRFLRKRYADLLPTIYFSDDIYAISSDADRCIMSAQALLAGLYPPSEIQVIDPQLRWQPIPVHTSPRDVDNMVAAKRPCKLYDEDLAKIYKSNKILETQSQYSSLLNKVSLNSGANISTVAAAEGLYNTLFLQKTLNLTLPRWVDDDVLSQLKQLAILSLRLFTETPYMARIRGGPLLKEINTRMEKVVKGGKQPKMFLVSGHDLTLINLLRTIGFTNTSWKPNFAAFLLVELHETEQGPVVKMSYNNGYDGSNTLETLEMEGCNNPCALDTFVSLTRLNIPDDWEKECVERPSTLNLNESM